MMLWQEKAGARHMHYVMSLVWPLELIQPPPAPPSLSPQAEFIVNRDLPGGLQANTASHRLSPLKRILSRLMVLA